VVGGFFQLILDANQLELAFHGLALVEQVHSFEKSYEAGLAAFEPGPHQISHLQHHQINTTAHSIFIIDV